MASDRSRERLHSIDARLRELAAGDRGLTVFGSNRHRYELRTCATPSELSAFEQAHRVTIPSEYRAFITRIGNGVAGPGYGLIPLAPWSRRDPVSGEPSAIDRPFPLATGWINTTAPRWTGALHDGCLRLADLGCGYFDVLVVTGASAGQVWCDTVTIRGGGGLAPIAASFFDWYEAWLDRSLLDWAYHQIVLDLRDPARPRAPRLIELTAAGVGGSAHVQHERLGYRQLYLGDIDGARRAFEQAADAAPSRAHGVPASFYQMMCDLHRVTGDDDARLDAACAGAAASPYATRTRLLWEKADVLFSRGRIDEALETLIERARRGGLEAVVEAVAALRAHRRPADADRVVELATRLPAFHPRFPERHQRLVGALAAPCSLPAAWRPSRSEP
jgi:hypothetical protein